MGPGDLIGNFRLRRLIARGGMGGVFEAVHRTIERRVAIKVLYSAYAEHPQVAIRFLNEARAVNLACHPGLVEIYDHGLLPCGLPYLIMEYLDGDSLGDRLHRAAGARLPGALDLARQIACALAAAHGKGIVHRDLKPENIILLREPDPPFRDRVKVLDFGVAKLTGLSVRKTQSGIALGTPQYMSPEQCLGLPTVDGKADVYALGIILFEMLAGRLPFEAELTLDYMIKQVRAEPPSLRTLSPTVTPRVEALVGAMLAKKAEQRPGMAEVAAALTPLAGCQQPADPRPAARSERETSRRLLSVDDDFTLSQMLRLLVQERAEQEFLE